MFLAFCIELREWQIGGLVTARKQYELLHSFPPPFYLPVLISRLGRSGFVMRLDVRSVFAFVSFYILRATRADW